MEDGDTYRRNSANSIDYYADNHELHVVKESRLNDESDSLFGYLEIIVEFYPVVEFTTTCILHNDMNLYIGSLLNYFGNG